MTIAPFYLVDPETMEQMPISIANGKIVWDRLLDTAATFLRSLLFVLEALNF